MTRQVAVIPLKVLAFFSFVAFALALTVTVKVHAAEWELKFGHYFPADQSCAINDARWAKLVEAMTGGRVKINVFPGGSIAAEHKSVEMAKAGTLDIGQATSQNMGAFTDIYRPFDVFFVVPSAEAAVRLLEQTQTGKEIDEYMQKTHGIKTLFVLPPPGFRKIWNTKRPVHVPADLKGLKLRSTATAIEQQSLKALGANPVPLPYPEIYMALQQGMLEGLHVDTETVIFAKQDELVKHGTAINAQQALEVTYINLKLWNSFPPDIQQAFMDATALTFWDRVWDSLAHVKSDEEKIEKKGVKVYHPTKEEMEKWKAAAKSVEQNLINQGLLEEKWFNRIRTELAEMQKRCIVDPESIKGAPPYWP